MCEHPTFFRSGFFLEIISYNRPLFTINFILILIFSLRKFLYSISQGYLPSIQKSIFFILCILDGLDLFRHWFLNTCSDGASNWWTYIRKEKEARKSDKSCLFLDCNYCNLIFQIHFKINHVCLNFKGLTIQIFFQSQWYRFLVFQSHQINHKIRFFSNM